MGNNFNFFSGKNAVLDFLNPDKTLPLPLVEIPERLNPFYGDGVRIYAKLLNMLPLTNVKSLPAFNMLCEAQEKGQLEDVNYLIENSSGNTVLSLAAIARLMGIEHTKAFVSHEVLRGKLQLLRLFGVEVIVNEEPICPDPADKESGIYKAKDIGKKNGWFNAGQYENDSNPGAHEKWTAKQIWEQLDGDLQLFCAGLGTTGTMVGCSRFFKKKDKKIKTVGVIRTPNNPIPGVRTRGLLKMIAFDWKEYTDDYEEIGTKESFEQSLALIRQGLVVGPSSGFALAGLLQYVARLKKEGTLDKLKNKQGILNAVFICCDSPLPYLDDYFTYLDGSHFPILENEELLLDRSKLKQESIGDDTFEISLESAYDMMYSLDKHDLWKEIENGKQISLHDNVSVIDVRDISEFNHFRIAGSSHIDFSDFVNGIEKYLAQLRGRKVIVVCSVGLKSHFISKLLQKEGVEAYSLKGGLTAWSNFDFPRWKPDVCFKK